MGLAALTVPATVSAQGSEGCLVTVMTLLLGLGVGGAPSLGAGVAELEQRLVPRCGQALAALRTGVRRVSWTILALFLIADPAHSSEDKQLVKFEDWNSVQELVPGVRTRVQILKSNVQAGDSRKIKGRLISTTTLSITLLTKEGETRTIPRGSIQTIRVRRPFMKRPAGWVLGVGVAIVACATDACQDITPLFVPLVLSTYAVPAALAGFFIMPTKLVYRARTTP